MPQSSVAAVETSRTDPRFDTATRLLAAAGYRLYAAPSTRDDIASIASALRLALREGDRERALRDLIQMNDNLVAVHGLMRGVLAVMEPELTGSKLWDAAVRSSGRGQSKSVATESCPQRQRSRRSSWSAVC
jgi:hypothetical protein